MQNVILPLLTSSLVFIHCYASNAADDSKKQLPESSPSLGTATRTSPLKSDDKISDLDQPNQLALYQAEFYPEQWDDQLKLTAALSAEDWDPESLINHDEEMLIALYASRLLAAIERDPVLRGKRPILDSTSSVPIIPSSSLPSLPVSRPSVLDSRPVPKEVEVSKLEMPVFDQDHFDRNGIGQQMVVFCSQKCQELYAQSKSGLAGVTPEALTQLLTRYSLDHNKNWPAYLLERISRHIVDADDLDEQDSGDGKASDGQKKF